jgi:hypothetical protein
MAVRLALRAGRSILRTKIPGTHICQRLGRPQRHSVAGRITSILKQNYLKGIRTRDIPACSIVRQHGVCLELTARTCQLGSIMGMAGGA